MEVFVERALKRLVAEGRGGNADLEKTLQKRKASGATASVSEKADDADHYFRPLQIACETRSARMKAIALDAIEKLVAWGNLTGNLTVIQNGRMRYLIDIVIETVCSCRDEKADQVQLQVVKCLLTAVSSTKCQVREYSLLLAVRSVYHIYLVTGNQVNRTTAKASLTQMLDLVFRRMTRLDEGVAKGEAIPERLLVEVEEAPEQPTAGERTLPADGGAGGELRPVSFGSNVYPELVAMLGFKPAGGAAVPPEAPVAPPRGGPGSAASGAGAPNGGGGGPPPAAAGGASQAGEKAGESKGEKEAGAGAPDSAKGTGTPSKPRFGARPEQDVEAEQFAFASVYHRDAFFLFRALCVLSAKGEDAEDRITSGLLRTRDDTTAVQSKVLALDLLHTTLQKAGAFMSRHSAFVAAARAYLAPALLKNFVSPHPSVVSLSLRIFVLLVQGFREYLSEEIEIFVTTVFLEQLQSKTASLRQKAEVVDSFRALAADSTTILEIFLNYDAAPEEARRERLFDRITSALTSIAQGRATGDLKAAAGTESELEAVRRSALATLTAIMHSMRKAAEAVSRPQLLKRQVSGGAGLEGAAAGVGVQGASPAPALGPPSGAMAALRDGPAQDAPSSPATGRDRDSVAGSATSGTPLGAGGADSEADAGRGDAGSAAGSGPGSAAAGGAQGKSVAEAYKEASKRREQIRRAALRFKMKPKDGVKYLREIGRVDDTPEVLAKCFLDLQDVLDKTAIGDYMGEDKEFNIAVMHAYVDQLDFTGMSFDEAIRYFLKGFRLPGEAQKIDRMMEKFAEVFCTLNPGVFSKNDTAFVLGYSVIMLNTDAHNPNIPPEKKMTLKGFLRNNSGIADGQDLPEQFLTDIYNNIRANAISLKEDDDLRENEQIKTASLSTADRHALRRSERSKLVKAGEERIKDLERKRRKRSTIMAASPIKGGQASGGAGAGAGASAGEGGAALALATLAEVDEDYVRLSDRRAEDVLEPMMEVAWGPMMASFSVNLEGSNDARVVQLCINGFKHAVSLAGVLGMSMERSALLGALVRYTMLDSPTRAFGNKNVLCCQAVVALAQKQGEWLGDAWGVVHRCISQIARLQALASGARGDSEIFGAAAVAAARNRSRGGAVPSRGGRRSLGGVGSGTPAQQEARQIERRNAQALASAIPESSLQRVYTNSCTLSQEAIVDFITHLTHVSLAELHIAAPTAADRAAEATAAQRGGASGPGAQSGAGGSPAGKHQGGGDGEGARVYSLQKVVETADYNLQVRGRLTWSRLWGLLSRVFTAVGCSTQYQLAQFAIDALKQLSLKFLDKPELGSFSFQRIFLSPFAAIMGAHPRAKQGIRELILYVFQFLLQKKPGKFRSGWQTVFAVHGIAARDPTREIISLAFNTVHQIVQNQFPQVVRNAAFADLVNCLVAFASNPQADSAVGVRSVDHLAELGAHLARGRVPLRDGNDEHVRAVLAADSGSDGVPRSTGGQPADRGAGAGAGAPAESKESKEGEEEGKETEGAEAARQASSSFVVQPDSGVFYDMDGEEHSDIRRASAGPMGEPDEAPAAGKATGQGQRAGFEDASPRGIADRHLTGERGGGGLLRRFDDRQEHTGAWWPVLTGLMRLVGDPREDVRQHSLDVLFALLRRFGGGFSEGLWHLVYTGVLLPIFDDARHTGGHQAAADREQKAEEAAAAGRHELMRSRAGSQGGAGARLGATDARWLQSSCLPALSALVRLQARFFPRLRAMMPELLQLLEDCIAQEVEGLARIGVSCLHQLLVEAGWQFDAECWEMVLALLGRLFVATTPRDLMDCETHLLGPSPGDFSEDEEAGGEGGHPVVVTVFGLGKLLASREDGVQVVQLPFGTLYTHGAVREVAEGGAGAPVPPSTPDKPMLPNGAQPPATRGGPGPGRATAPVPRAMDPPPALPFNPSRVLTQCVVQLELVSAVGILANSHVGALTLGQLKQLLGLLEECADFARRFNSNRPLREALLEAGFMKKAKFKRVPSLLRQEKQSTEVLLQLLLGMHTQLHAQGGLEGEGGKRHKLVLQRLREVAGEVVGRFVRLDASVEAMRVQAQAEASSASQAAARRAAQGGRRVQDPARAARSAARQAVSVDQSDREVLRECSAFGPLVVRLLEGCSGMSAAEFRGSLWWLYPLLVQLIPTGNPAVRRALRGIFENKLPAVLPLDAPAGVLEGEGSEAEEDGGADAAGAAAGTSV